ncbi:MAG: shikimate kinase [Clostridiales bacterium GWF2_36_10]|nr:MAG: shikimate kinase [Clostridiales bacterium GWF2_36_10]HAN20239.1 shikimate kinase [Clostridiales bacterium]
MKLVIIFGPQAVGKMTVGQELAKITDLKLFHNHMTIDLVSNYFSYGTPEGKRLVKLFRQVIFDSVSKSDLSGLIFTYVWAFNYQEDWDYIRDLCQLFESRGADTYFVELETDIYTRLERNKTPNRLSCKPTKRNLEFTERDILDSANKYRLNSNIGEITKESYLRIDNTFLPPENTAKMIKDTFKL